MSTPVSTYWPVVRSKYHTDPSVASPTVRNPRKYTRFIADTYWPSNRVPANGLALATCQVIWVTVVKSNTEEKAPTPHPFAPRTRQKYCVSEDSGVSTCWLVPVVVAWYTMSVNPASVATWTVYCAAWAAAAHVSVGWRAMFLAPSAGDCSVTAPGAALLRTNVTWSLSVL